MKKRKAQKTVTAQKQKNTKKAKQTAPYDPTKRLEALIAHHLPRFTKEWREQNKLTHKSAPSGLSRHVRDTHWVMCCNPSTTCAGGLLLGAEVYRRNNRKLGSPYQRMCEAFVELDEKGNICRRFTDWEPNANVKRMRPGIFIELFKRNIGPWQLGVKGNRKDKRPLRVCALDNPEDLLVKDSTCELDSFTHTVWKGTPRGDNISFLRNLE